MHLRPRGGVGASTSTRCATAACRSRFHFNGTVLYRGEDDRLQVVLVPWSCSARWSDAGRGVAAHDRGPLPGRRLDPACSEETLERLSRAQGRAGTALVRRDRARAAGGGMSVERLLSTLLYEGYALYPYTPGATKNATPTPFGIVYPPVYAAGGRHTFDRARMQLVLEPAAPDATVGGTRRVPRAERRAPPGRRAADRARATAARELIAEDGVTVPFAFDAVAGPRAAERDAARRRARAGRDVRPQHDRGRRGPRSRRRAALVAALDPPRRAARRGAASPRRSPRGRRRPRRSRRATTRTSSRSSPPPPTTPCSAPRSSCPITRRSRRRATATCSTRPRSRRRCCCTCSRSATASGRRSPSRTRRCARCSRAPRPRGRRRSRGCAGA